MEELKEMVEMTEPTPEGDGKAVFLSDMTDVEVEEYERNVVHGWGKVLTKLGIK